MKITLFTKEMNKFRDINNIEMTFSFSFSLPYELKLPERHYYFKTRGKFFYSLPDRERNIILYVKNRVHKNQSIAIRHSTFELSSNGEDTIYSFVSTDIIIMVESFYSEKAYVYKKFDENKDELITDLIQSTMEFFLFKYNESLGGNHFVNPSIYDCSRIACFYVDRSGRDERSVISPNGRASSCRYKEESLQENLEKDFQVWKHFYNESKYSYEVYDFMRSIIYVAISLETYITQLIQLYDLEDEGYVKDKKGNFLSLKKRINKLISSGYIKNSIDTKELQVLIDLVMEPRNDIMHGRLNDLMNLRKRAQITKEAIDKIFNNWERI
ncbi:hypothetical protein RH915_10290 [Serpentinicella sp. ANB-PHB4]|uniref:hypothetical protein n=1 Tax=Serpentinicella sp. ANB-PHB4 TaxID=3074076 RepID=UPI00286285AD|nr:hypothetical protein [Serpentinicella sp. ANB-PHB4]MDR5659878.1 hypothetical protein [Serpentinicella sp. ANB-PHB4]